MSDTLFFILALLACSGALGMIALIQPMFSALSFIVTLLSLAGIYALLGSSFLFAIQIIIYAGAIVSLILFIIMFLNIKPENAPLEPFKNRFILLSALAISPFSYLLISMLDFLPHAQALPEAFGDLKSVGSTLFKEYLLPFEAISILLLISLIGAVVLAQKDKSKEDGVCP